MRPTRWLLALLGLGACFEDMPMPAEGTTGEPTTQGTITPTTAPPLTTSASASSTSGPSGPSTTQGDDDDLGETVGSADSTTGEDDESSSSSDGGSSSSTGEPLYEGPYGDCWEGVVQQGRYLCPPSPCVVSPPDHSACAPEACAGGCEPGPDGVGATCLDTITTDTVPAVCVIACAGEGSPCPDGMDCAETTFQATAGDVVWLCMWP